MSASAERLDALERTLERSLAIVPYLLLTIPAVLSMLTGEHGGAERMPTLGLVALAATWISVMSVMRRPGPVYVVGLIILIAALSFRDVWFASFFGFAGYLTSWHHLRGNWRFVGITATATVTVACFTDFSAPTPVSIVTAVVFIAAIVVLVSLFSLLGDVTQTRSAERARMVRQLEETLRENEGLHAQLLVQAREAGILDERQRLAREIHDTLAQGLAGIVTQLQAAERLDGETADQDARRRHVSLATQLARESLDEARRSVGAIGPRVLESARLPEAIATVADEWAEREGMSAEVTTTGAARPLHPEVEVALLRIAQEALTNVAKHASATRAGITLSYMGDVVALDVRDDGVGFDSAGNSAVTRDSYGLISMRQRAARLGGTFEIESEAGVGTAISARVPAILQGEHP